MIACQRQVTLWGNRGKRRRAMRLHGVVHANSTVGPEDAAGLRIEAVNEDTHERPDAGSEPHFPIAIDRATACRPRGDHSAMTQHPTLGGTAIKFPQEFSAGGVQAVEMPVIRDKPNLSLAGCRGESHGRPGIEPPELFTSSRIIGGHRIIG